MILVTGGTGFIGQQVVKDLLAQGEKVRLLCRSPMEMRGVEVIKGDLLDKESLKAALKDVENVIHLAAKISYTAPREELFSLNVESVRCLAEAFKGKKFVLASSVSVYGDTWEPAGEEAPFNPNNIYGETKIAAERALREAGIPSAALRLSVIFGAGSQKWFRVLQMLSKGFPVPGTSKVTNVLHVSDVSRAFILALQKGSGPYNIAAEHSIPIKQLVLLLARELEIKARFWPPWLISFLAKFKGNAKAQLGSFTTNRIFKTEKAKEELGFSPKADFEKEIKRMVEWYKSVK
ncbi:MAG: NAD-dependent epimerase/dehydratase family protein [Candidatus Aenigmarchaeota archaeon]|nr:NAD-dependent epimerase/dehydratase family protein [Candidatus Aenigmarchaeota archaeon]